MPLFRCDQCGSSPGEGHVPGCARYARVICRKPTREELWASRDEAIRQRDEALAELELARTSRVLTCVYCGHQYPQDTPAAGSEVLTAHIAQCEKHPMHVVTAELELVRAELNRVHAAIGGRAPHASANATADCVISWINDAKSPVEPVF